MIPIIVILVLLLLATVLIILNIKIVPQAEKYVIERLGTYYSTWEAGLHFKIPLIDSIVQKVSTKEKVLDFPPQSVITKDNVTIQIDTIVYAMVTDAKLYCYGTDNPTSATEFLTATTLRNIVGEMDLDTTLTSRDDINAKMRAILDEATDAWGIKVIRVEIKNIQPPKDIQDAMERQMKAEREKRANILEAEGEKQSRILRAEGNKQAAILEAEAIKESKILQSDAAKIQKIREAEGEAEAIMKTQAAYATSIERLNSAKPTKEVLMLKAYETMTNMADGNATKLIVPSDLANMSGFIAALKESASMDDLKNKNSQKKPLNIQRTISANKDTK